MNDTRLDQLVQLAREHQEAGRDSEADAVYRAALLFQPDHPEVHYRLGQLARGRGRTVEALSHLRTALESNPAEDGYWASYAEMLQESGHIEEAEAIRALAQARGQRGAETQELTHHRPAARQPAPAELEALWTLFQAERFEEAESSARRLAQRYPNAAQVWKIQGATLERLGRRHEALEVLQTALSLDPTDHETANNLGVNLLNLGRLDEALAYFQQVLALVPNYSEAHYNAANALHGLGRWHEAEAAFLRSIEQRPDFAPAYNNLGNALREQGRLSEAETAFRRTIELWPTFAPAYNNLGNALREQGRLSEAEVCYRQALALDSDSAEVHNDLGLLLHKFGRLREAEASYRQALALNPNFSEAHHNLALTLNVQRRFHESEASFCRALELGFDVPELHNNLGNVYESLARVNDAEASYRRALALRPDFAVAVNNIGRLYQDSGQLLAAESYYRQALELSPKNANIYSNLIFTLAYTNQRPPLSMRRETERWERAVLDDSERLEARMKRFERAPRAGRPLRLGLVSAELGQHAVAYFLLSWLRVLDPARIRLYLYPTAARSEPQVEAFRALDAQWTPLIGLSDTEALERMRADQLDVLVDTSGHSSHNRLGVIARRVAPVQCHYIGYFATTGLSEMDYFIGDATLIPPALEAQFTEQIWRLPRPWMAYAPLEPAPEPAWRPDPAGTLWLGSFNNLTKVREECVRLWARVLRALPEARLLLKHQRSDDPGTQERLRLTLEGEGIDPERLVFAKRTAGWAAHMAQYDRLDIALDPIPMTGGSTAFDALWMGVPLVTLAGESLIGRQGAAALAGLGRPEWIARDADEYVRIVVELARDVEGRQAIRATQREQMRRSPLCDGEGMARALETAFEGMFDRWWTRQ